jgi:predicted ATP-dependent endonuclease of OLD family
MAAISSIDIENFRCFKKLRVEGLASVNLIVGANNSGKTALLEAIEAVVSPDSPFLLYRASFERGEFRRRLEPAAAVVEIDLRHGFMVTISRAAQGSTCARRETASSRCRVALKSYHRMPALHRSYRVVSIW